MQWTELSRDEIVIPGESRNLGATPYFRYESIFNEPQSQLQGKPVHELKEVVEIRFAANPQYKPVFEVTEFCETDASGRVVTWAERYKPQYQAFLSGGEQVAEGTPLEELLAYGMSQRDLSYCRAQNIYSIEALAHVDGVGRKRMGIHGNELIPMAKRYLDNRRDGSQQVHEINELKRQLAEMRAQQGMGEEIKLSIEMPEIVPAIPEEDKRAQMKDEIEKLTGVRPRGNPSEETLSTMLEQAKAA